MGWVVYATHRPLYPRESEPVPIVQEAGWAPGSVWTSLNDLALTGISSPDSPARSQSLYRLIYPGPKKTKVTITIIRLKPKCFKRSFPFNVCTRFFALYQLPSSQEVINHHAKTYEEVHV